MANSQKDSSGGFLKTFSSVWSAERPTVLAAALAYYGMFSIVPIIYIALTVAGMFFNRFDFENIDLFAYRGFFGPQVAEYIDQALETISQPSSSSWLTSLISILALIYTASGLFYQVQFSVNRLWNLPTPEQQGILAVLRQRAFAFLMVIGMGLLLVLAVAATTIVSLLGDFLNLGGSLPVATTLAFWLLIFLVFLVLYRVIPETDIKLGDVWVGALAASGLFTLGLWLVRLIVGTNRFSSALAAAGSVVIILVGIYYGAQIFLAGVVLTRVYTEKYGSLSKKENN